MRRYWIPLSILALLPFPTCAGQAAHGAEAPPVPLSTTRDQASYALGLNIGRDLAKNDLELNGQALIQGIVDALNKAQPRLSAEQCNAALQVLQREMATKMQARQQNQGTQNQRDGQAFMAENGKKPGVVALPSGLQYMVLKQGNGPSPKVTDTVRTHYHGTLIDGTVFDSSVQRGEPISFPVNGVIRGWTEALQLMKVGDKWRLFVPSDLAYGPRGAGDKIGPHTTLIFEVELLGIE